MNQISPPPRFEIIPESAPFTSEQRTWLNGFFAGMLVPESAGGTPLSTTQDAAVMASVGDGDDGASPWHDPAIPIAERMKLATGRPLRRRMMAAMAQQDCGQCGSNCEAYATAIATRKEARLNLCSPGGKDTVRALKALADELDNTPTAAAPTMPVLADDGTHAPGTSRQNPAEAVFLSRRRLNKEGSEKETWHIELDIDGAGIDYLVGDSLGVFPRNDLGLVDQIIAMLGASPLAPVNGRTFRDVLRNDVSLAPAPDSLFELLSFLTGGPQRTKARALAHGEDPDGDAAHLDVLAALQKFAGVRPHPEAFVEALEQMQPRLYSISSSPAATPGRLTLTVAAVRYMIGKRKRLGTASTFLADRITPGERLRLYVQKAHSFRLPDDPATPVIMIGPGTGIAPFRAFLHERAAGAAPGRNWLFFGHQRSDLDFFYADELSALKASGVLTRLSLAWSRDGADKFYVQDRMREVGREIWSWLADGASVYVCGDAKRMAKDVESALVDIVAKYGARPIDEAVTFVIGLKKAGRYLQDVY